MKFNLKTPACLLLSFVLFLTIVCGAANAWAAEKYYYEIKIYHFKTEEQEIRLDNYLQNACLPALHRMGIKNIGVFKPVANDSLGKRVYVLIPFKTWNELEEFGNKLLADQQYLNDGKDYINAPYNDSPYTRMESIILRAFAKMPVPAIPELTASKTERVYELRSYESATETYNVNKVKMFNDGDEVALFKRLGFNAVFYAEVLAGSHIPNLMYMITFNDMEDHDKHWKAFVDDPYWKSLSAKSEYQNNVSHIDALFLHPTAYSDF